MNETQKPKRKYGSYCLRSSNGEKKRKCHTGECVDLVHKERGVPVRRCQKGTRRCSDQKCYTFTKKSNNPISKKPFKIIKDKLESLGSTSSIASSGYGEKIVPIIEEDQQQNLFSKKKSKRSKPKKSKSRRNYTNHAKYGKKISPENEEKIQPIPPPEISSLNLPTINTKKRRRNKRKRINSKSKFVYDAVSPKPPRLRAVSVNSSSSQKVTPQNKSILLLENGKEKSPVVNIEEDTIQPIEKLYQSPVANIEEENRENSSEKGEETPVIDVEEEPEPEEEDDLQPIEKLSQSPDANVEPKETPVIDVEENQEEGEEQEDQEEGLPPLEKLSQTSPTPQPSSSPAKKSSDISVGSINSEGSSGGKKHSKKHHKKKSKKHHKKKSKKHRKKQSKKHRKKQSKKHRKKQSKKKSKTL